ncbi:hypothetical protein CULT_2370003 [[Clostridium] ultunense Esp]|nr:hypothetical protein CULT_2370003 [[Clostridium] ultunense Esp]
MFNTSLLFIKFYYHNLFQNSNIDILIQMYLFIVRSQHYKNVSIYNQKQIFAFVEVWLSSI